MMRKSQILSGEELVAKGAKKLDVCLPELGIKDVIPNRSWLEQKQIQSAIEARKHLIEVPRIEKCGILSHANWNQELGLAEVTQQVGGYWQWLGHHKRNQLYLNPEEALYLIETNCLQLKYNKVTVSLQQAYSLLLKGKITLLQYKVYASLSRVGNKVLRHDMKQVVTEDVNEKSSVFQTTKDSSNTEVHETEPSENITDETDETNVNNVSIDLNLDDEAKQGGSLDASKESILSEIKIETVSRKDLKLQKLMNRQYKILSRKKLDKYFENMPDMCQKEFVSIKVPEETYLPRNVFLNNTSYLLNLHNVRTARRTLSENTSYSYSDVNEAHVRRIRGPSQNESSFQNSWTSPQYPYNSFPRFQQHFFPRFQHHFWPFGQRMRHSNQFHFNYSFQRPFSHHMFFAPNQQMYYQRQRLFCPNQNCNPTENRKRTRTSAKQVQLDAIIRLSDNLKRLILSSNMHPQNLQPLQRLIMTFNIRYKARLHLTDQFDLVNEEANIDTIELDDDDEPKVKITKPNNSSFQENFQSIKHLALKLKDLESKGEACSRQRRAFSNLISTFNKNYNAEVYCDNHYEVHNKNHIILDSSDSDCILETTDSNSKTKTFINPFNVLRKQALHIPSTSKENTTTEKESKYAELSKIFKKTWLPGEDDFGTAEVISNKAGYESLIDSRSEEYLFDFIKDYSSDYRNWIDIKISFWETVDDTPNVSQNESNTDSSFSPNSLVKPGECKDMASVLKTLRIIPTCEKTAKETCLAIDFDVYNKDVPNFKKSHKPSPHYRIVCIDEHTSLPSGEDIATLYSQYKDGVPLVFAIVGIGSISYLQMKPTNLPLYIPSNDVL